MGADFAMLVSCSVRDALSEDPVMATETLVAEIKQRSSLDAVLLHHASGAMPKSILKVVLGPNGPVETTIPLEDMMASARRLDALAARCDGCVLRAEDKPFGCTGYIQYPITAATEEWLVASMSEEGTLAAKLRKELARKIGAHGSIGSGWRARQILQREKAAEKKTGTRWLVLSGAKVSGDEVIEWLFFSGTHDEHGSPYWQLDARSALELLVIMERVDFEGTLDELLALQGVSQREARVRLKVLGEEDAPARPFEAYFRALHIAFVHDALLGVYA